MSLRFITFDEAIDLFKNGYTGSAFVHSANGQFWILKDLRAATLDELIDAYIFTAFDPQEIAAEIPTATAPEPEEPTAVGELIEYAATAPLEELIATDCVQEEEPAAAPDPEEQKAEPEEGQAAAAERGKKILPGGIKSNLSTFEMYQLRQKGMTLEKIAGMAGVSHQTVANRLKKYNEMSEAQQARSVKEAKARHAKH